MKLLALLLLVLQASTLQAATCGEGGGANVYNQQDGSGYLMHLYLEKRDVQLVFPGKKFTQDKSAPEGRFAFWIDGIHYQVLTTRVTPFLDKGKRPDDATLLARHAAWESKYASTT